MHNFQDSVWRKIKNGALEEKILSTTKTLKTVNKKRDIELLLTPVI